MPEATGPATSLGIPTLDDDVDNPSAAGINTIVAAINGLILAPAAARVTHNADQSIPNVSMTTLAFNTEAFDLVPAGVTQQHDTVTNNSRLTCRVAGKYQITGTVEWPVNGTGGRVLQVLLNGSTQIVAETRVPSSSTTTDMTVSTVYDLAAGDYVQLQVLQTSGGALSVVSQSAFTPLFMFARVA